MNFSLGIPKYYTWYLVECDKRNELSYYMLQQRLKVTQMLQYVKVW
jgi:hypothetical protein